MASANDLIRYITERTMEYIVNPNSSEIQERKRKEHWTIRWFGWLPFAISMVAYRKRWGMDRKPRH